ncbi:MAG: mechanosensitive ion channel family protein [Chitinophagales bacterium]|nr:mechanosensitive ion channel family protein [Chitinophagales bacterium]MCZ2394847.1 mechanosensitive ion channel family protein [Chitinophagales bacterium]
MDVFKQLHLLTVWKLPILILVVFSFAFTINWVVRRYVSSLIERNAASLRVDPTNYNFLKNGFSITIYAISAFFVFSQIPAFKDASQTIFTATGIFAAVLALASQQAFSNIFSGIFIIIFRPFRVDDIIEFEQSKIGIVEDITLRHTVIRNFENKRYIIPNSSINNSIILNSSIKDEPIRRHMELLISYDAPLERVFEIITEEVLAHPYHIDFRKQEDFEEGIHVVEIRVIEYLPIGLKLRVYLWADDHRKAFRLHTDVNFQLKLRFDKEGIPFPYTLQRLNIETFPGMSPKDSKNE